MLSLRLHSSLIMRFLPTLSIDGGEIASVPLLGSILTSETLHQRPRHGISHPCCNDRRILRTPQTSLPARRYRINFLFFHYFSGPPHLRLQDATPTFCHTKSRTIAVCKAPRFSAVACCCCLLITSNPLQGQSMGL